VLILQEFLNCAPVLVLLCWQLWSGIICTKDYRNFTPHLNRVVTLPENIRHTNINKHLQ